MIKIKVRVSEPMDTYSERLNNATTSTATTVRELEKAREMLSKLTGINM